MKALSSIILVTATLVVGQRPFFAGNRPIGFPDTPNRTTTESLDNRFGEGTTERLPLEANGDRDLVDRLSQLPIDKQPFWFINWQALEAHRNNPQTYPQKPNVFVDPPNAGNIVYPNVEPSNSNSPSQFNSSPNRPNSGSTITNPNNTPIEDRFGSLESGNPISNSGIPNSNSGFVKPSTSSGISSSGNRNGVQQIASTQTQAPVKKLTDYYPQQTNYRRPGYGR